MLGPGQFCFKCYDAVPDFRHCSIFRKLYVLMYPGRNGFSVCKSARSTSFSQQHQNWAAAQQKQQNHMCAHRILRSACTSAQSDQSQSLRCELRTQGFFMRTAKTDQTGRLPMLIWVFAERTCDIVGFVVLRLINKQCHQKRSLSVVRSKKRTRLHNPLKRTGQLALYLKFLLVPYIVWANSKGSGETARMRRLAWAFAVRLPLIHMV